MFLKERTIKKEEADDNFFPLQKTLFKLRNQTLFHQELSNLHRVGSSAFAEIV